MMIINGINNLAQTGTEKIIAQSGATGLLGLALCVILNVALTKTLDVKKER